MQRDQRRSRLEGQLPQVSELLGIWRSRVGQVWDTSRSFNQIRDGAALGMESL